MTTLNRKRIYRSKIERAFCFLERDAFYGMGVNHVGHKNYCQTPVKRFINNLRSVKAGKGELATRGFKTCVNIIATAGSQAQEFTGNCTITCYKLSQKIWK